MHGLTLTPKQRSGDSTAICWSNTVTTPKLLWILTQLSKTFHIFINIWYIKKNERPSLRTGINQLMKYVQAKNTQWRHVFQIV